MANLTPSLKAHLHLKARMTACSWQAGWRSLLLRAYIDPPVVEEFTTAPTGDQLIVLVTEGSSEIEGRYQGRWSRAQYRPGSLGMTAPGEEVTLQWRGDAPHSTLQLHLPAATINALARELWPNRSRLPELPNQLIAEDPLVRQIIVALKDALTAGAPDLYAETAANFLTIHLLLRHGEYRAALFPPRDEARLRRVDDFMHDHLDSQLSLAAIAEVANMSRFHFLRMFKRAYGETPLKRLTRLRMEKAQRRLLHGRESITEIAFACGYESPAHFSAAFRRSVGVAPSAYRRAAS